MLIKATQSMESLAIDFKGSLPSRHVTVIDEEGVFWFNLTYR